MSRELVWPAGILQVAFLNLNLNDHQHNRYTICATAAPRLCVPGLACEVAPLEPIHGGPTVTRGGGGVDAHP